MLGCRVGGLACYWGSVLVISMPLLVISMPSVSSPLAHPQLKPTTPAPMTASERNNIGKKRSARESFMLAYEVRR